MTPSSESDVLLTACGAATPAPGVIDRMVSHLAREAEVGGYDAAAEVADELVVARRRVASLLGLEHGNVSLSDSGTSATVSLFQAMATAGSSPSGGFIVTDPREFGPNHELLRRLAARSGAGIRLLGLTPEGRLDIDQLGQLVSAGRVGLVWLSLAHAHAGSTNAVSELVRALDGRPTETWVVLDACQSFGQLDDDLAALDPDAVIGTSRKWLRGPRGVGFGWVHPRRLDDLEPWPSSTPAPLGVLERREAAAAPGRGAGHPRGDRRAGGLASSRARGVAGMAHHRRPGHGLGHRVAGAERSDRHPRRHGGAYAAGTGRTRGAGHGIPASPCPDCHGIARGRSRLAPQADQPWNDLRRAVEVLGQATD